MLISNLPLKDTVPAGGKVPVDSRNIGTYSMLVTDLVTDGMAIAGGVAARRNTYRGEFIGNEFTASQSAEINTGEFRNMFIGDYWEIDGIRYTISDFNYFNPGMYIKRNHIVIVADIDGFYQLDTMDNMAMIGYANCAWRLIDRENLLNNIIIPAFSGGNVVTYQDFLSNGGPPETPDSNETSVGFSQCSVELLSEIMLLGYNVRGNIKSSRSLSQLALFRLDPSAITSNDYWLRDFNMSTGEAAMVENGYITYMTPDFDTGIRVVFGVSGQGNMGG